jgi:hypothetical protein
MPVPRQVYMRALRRAAQGLGSVEALRAHLGVSMGQLNSWLEGEARPPDAVFLIVVDLLADEELSAIKQGMRNQGSEGSPA